MTDAMKEEDALVSNRLFTPWLNGLLVGNRAYFHKGPIKFYPCCQSNVPTLKNPLHSSNIMSIAEEFWRGTCEIGALAK
jgi:hypothetical protein